MGLGSVCIADIRDTMGLGSVCIADIRDTMGLGSVHIADQSKDPAYTKV